MNTNLVPIVERVISPNTFKDLSYEDLEILESTLITALTKVGEEKRRVRLDENFDPEKENENKYTKIFRINE